MFIQFFSNKGSENIYVDVPFVSIEGEVKDRMLKHFGDVLKREDVSYIGQFSISEAVKAAELIFLEVFQLSPDFDLELELVLD